jgi:FixJ family two-component response regulator
MTGPRPRIAVIDDDDGVRLAVVDLLRAADLGARAFSSAEAFLARPAAERFDCLIVDINLPGMTGVALLSALAALGRPHPAVLITGRHDPATLDLLGRVASVPRLTKPFGDAELFDALRLAMGAAPPSAC